MKFLTDFFSSPSLDYPGGQSGGGEGQCVEEPFHTPERTGFFERFFAPKEVAYPVPVCRVRQAEKYPESRKPEGGAPSSSGSAPPSSGIPLSGSAPSSGSTPSAGTATGWVLGGPQPTYSLGAGSAPPSGAAPGASSAPSSGSSAPSSGASASGSPVPASDLASAIAAALAAHSGNASAGSSSAPSSPPEGPPAPASPSSAPSAASGSGATVSATDLASAIAAALAARDANRATEGAAPAASVGSSAPAASVTPLASAAPAPASTGAASAPSAPQATALTLPIYITPVVMPTGAPANGSVFGELTKPEYSTAIVEKAPFVEQQEPAFEQKAGNGQFSKIAPVVEARSSCAGVEKVLRAHSFNPEFRECATAQEMYQQEVLGEESLPPRMVSKDSTPVVFIVPEGCDSMDLLYGPVEVNPGCGCDADLEEIVTVGEVKLSANVCDFSEPLVPGDQVIVTVPWRAASWVEIQAARLRVTVYAHFFSSQS